MTRMKFALCGAALLSMLAIGPMAWTQDSREKPVPAKRATDPSRPSVTRAVPQGGNFPGAGGMLMSRGGMGAMQMGEAIGMAAHMMGQSGPMRRRMVTRTISEVVYQPVPADEFEQLQAFENAMESLEDAKNDEDKKTASETILEHLTKQFEQDLLQREKELADVEERLKSLRQQLEKRKSSKAEIVKLRLKTIINNAEGLGFPGEADSPESKVGVYSPVRGSGFPPGGAYSVPHGSEPSVNEDRTLVPSRPNIRTEDEFRPR